MSLTERPFIIVDTETTGLRASSDRVIEIGAVKLVKGEIVEEFSQLINPGCSIPQRITRINGISTGMVYDQPAMEEVMPAFLEFLGADVMAAHNLSFDLGFLNAELGRLSCPPLANEAICTLRLARRLMRGLRSKGLSSLADFYGIAIENRHRALGDARATALVLQHFLTQIEYELGPQDLPELLKFQYRTYAPAKHLNKNLVRIRSEVLPHVPVSPGVYFMKDRKGQVIYVGKAKSLKSRVRSYFTSIEAHAVRTRNLVDHIADVEWRPLGSELEALLEESRLIKEMKPRFNRALRYYRHRPFIRLSLDDAYPRVSLQSYLVDDGASYFGPMGTRRQGELVIDLINRFFLLRECDDATFKRNTSCLYADMDRCKAPCDEELSPAWYASEVDRVKRFLMGEEGERIVAKIQEAMVVASKEMEYEQAALYRDLKELVERLLGRQRCIAAPVMEHNAVVIDRTLDDTCNRFLIVRYGRLVDTLIFDQEMDEAARSKLAEGLGQHFSDEAARPDRYFKAEIEDIRLLVQWLYLNRDAITIVEWQPELDPAQFAAKVCSQIDAAVTLLNPATSNEI